MKRHEKTSETVKFVMRQALGGVPRERIAKRLGITEDTLRKYYSEELEEALDTPNANVVGKLYQMAMEGNVAALIFWCKARLNWSERQQLEIQGAIEHKHCVDAPPQESREQWLERKQKELEAIPVN